MSKFIVTYRKNNGYRETFDSLEELLKYFDIGQDAKKFISYIQEIKETYEQEAINKLFNPESPYEELAQTSDKEGNIVKVGGYVTYDFAPYSTYWKQYSDDYNRVIARVIKIERNKTYDSVTLYVLPEYYEDGLNKFSLRENHRFSPSETEYDKIDVEDIEDVVDEKYLTTLKAGVQTDFEYAQNAYNEAKQEYNKCMDIIKVVMGKDGTSKGNK